MTEKWYDVSEKRFDSLIDVNEWAKLCGKQHFCSMLNVRETSANPKISAMCFGQCHGIGEVFPYCFEKNAAVITTTPSDNARGWILTNDDDNDTKQTDKRKKRCLKSQANRNAVLYSRYSLHIRASSNSAATCEAWIVARHGVCVCVCVMLLGNDWWSRRESEGKR